MLFVRLELDVMIKLLYMLTVRGDTAEDILERGLKIKEFEVRKKNFLSQETLDLTFKNILI